MDNQRPLNIGMVITYDLSETGGGVKQHARQLAEALQQTRRPGYPVWAIKVVQSMPFSYVAFAE